MWEHTLARLRGGLAVCVFDISDRLQHMFFRYRDAHHPANAGRGSMAGLISFAPWRSRSR